MYHNVPAWGDYEHGIIEYSPKFFWALASTNDYEIVKLTGWADGNPAPLNANFMRDLNMTVPPVSEKVWIQVLLRKSGNRPFRGLNDPAFSPQTTDPREPASRAKSTSTCAPIASSSTTLKRSSEPSAARTSYEQMGYTVVRRLAPPDAVDRVHAALAQEVYPSTGVFLRHPSVTREVNAWMTLGNGTRVVKNALFNPHLQSEAGSTGEAILELICTDQFADRLAAIDGDDKHTITQIILFFMSPGTDMHIDGWSMDTERPGGTFTAWIALESVNADNGPVGVFPWERSGFVAPSSLGVAADVDDLRQAYATYSDGLARKIRDRKIDCIVPMLDAGDAVVFSSITPHVSMPPRRSDVTRLALQVIIRPTSERWGGNMLSRMKGEITIDDVDALRRVNHRWFVLPTAAS